MSIQNYPPYLEEEIKDFENSLKDDIDTLRKKYTKLIKEHDNYDKLQIKYDFLKEDCDSLRVKYAILMKAHDELLLKYVKEKYKKP